MSIWKRWLFVAAGVFACLPQAWADTEVDALLNKLVEKGILSSYEAQEVRNEVASVASEKDTKFGDIEKKVKKLDEAAVWKGDIRLRDEYRQGSGSFTDRHRQRIRFRLGVEKKVADTLKVKARLATGSTDDPISTNQSLELGFRKKTFNLDEAYVEWSPVVESVDSLMIRGGITPNPFWTVAPLVWDGDLSFDGGSIHLVKTFNPTFFLNGGVWSLDTDAVTGASLYGIQGGAEFSPFQDVDSEFFGGMKLKNALAYVDYHNVYTATNDNAVASTLGRAGNSTSLKDVAILNGTTELSSKLNDIPVKLIGEYVHNLEADDNETGWLAGLTIGKAETPFDLKKGWELSYFYELLEPNATFGPFADSDFGGGGTNHQGHVIGVNFAMLKKSTLGVKWFDTEVVGGAKADRDTMQVDWVTKF